MDVLQPKPVVRSAVEPVDVLIITAAAGEDNAVRAVDEGGLGEWDQAPGPSGFGFAVWRRWYQASDGSGRLSVALCRAYEMGSESTGNAAAPWLADRPRPRTAQADWVLKELLDGRSPLDSPDLAQCCANWSEVVGQLQSDKLIRLKGSQPQLTARGQQRIQQALFNHGGQLPAQVPWRIRVGPLGTGSNLVRDAGIWDRLGQTQRHILGLDMEGSVIGFTAHVQNVPSFIVAKGVMDYAEPGRSQGFRAFAARAAAEVLLGFLRRHLAPLPRRTAAEILRPNTAQRPEAASPATLLNARYQVVPFFAALRRRELDVLDAWCREDGAASVRLLVGPGGTGKTRLMIHWSSRLRAAEPAWHAGFLPERVTGEDLDTLLAGDRPTLIVVDYAESRSRLIDLLRRLAARPVQGRPPCRVVLLARDIGDWWLALRQQDAEIADLLDRYEPSRLDPVPLEGDLRRQAFEQARECFAAENGTGSDQDDRCLSPLPGLLNAAEFAAGMRRMAAAATLLGGLPSRDAVESLRGRVRGPDLPSVPLFLHWLYPGRGEAGRQSAWVSSLEPDLLGEALVARVLADPDTPQDYLERVFADGGEASLRNGFVVLGRIALWDEPQGTAWLARLLEADVPGRARTAFDAALTLGGHTALAPLGQVLAAALARSGTHDLAAEIEPLVPWETVSLREVGLWAVRTLVDRLPPSSVDEAAIRVRARLLLNAGKRFSDLGRREEALQATAEAVRLTLPLVERYPQAFLDDLRGRLQDLRQRCTELDQDPDADPLVRQATELLARLDATSGQ